jgi:hypothetical protein
MSRGGSKPKAMTGTGAGKGPLHRQDVACAGGVAVLEAGTEVTRRFPEAGTGAARPVVRASVSFELPSNTVGSLGDFLGGGLEDGRRECAGGLGDPLRQWQGWAWVGVRGDRHAAGGTSPHETREALSA